MHISGQGVRGEDRPAGEDRGAAEGRDQQPQGPRPELGRYGQHDRPESRRSHRGLRAETQQYVAAMVLLLLPSLVADFVTWSIGQLASVKRDVESSVKAFLSSFVNGSLKYYAIV